MIRAAIALTAFSLLTGCTIAFHNISTHGTATDILDSDQKADAKVDANVSLPIKAL